MFTMNKKLMLFFLLATGSASMTMTEQTTADHSITIFVHGTFPVRKILQYSAARFLIYCPQGLSLAKNLPKYYHFYKVAKGCVENRPDVYSFDQFYTFGWKSEHVYHQVRTQAAQDLVNQLQNLVTTYYHNHNVIPKIKLIGFSHGGNVVLHTADYLPLKINNQLVDVTAWLFGTPVQKINKDLVNSKNFTKIYSIYSKTDWMQRMDPQGLRNAPYTFTNMWSDRMFEPTDRCIQVEFTVNGKSISHSYYRSIFKYFATIQTMIEEKSHNLDSGNIAINLEI